jgi:LPXTG-motif cell wall-anchored protein
MKRLAMAAAVALTASLLGIGPAAAATAAEGSAASAAEPTQSPGDEDGGDSADPEDPADSGGEDGQTTPPDEGDGADETDEPDQSEPIDASFSLDRTEMTAEEISTDGIGYTIDSLEAGDVVTAQPGSEGARTVESDGTFSGTITGGTELHDGDVVDVTVTVQREGQQTKTFNGSVTVVDDEAAEAELSVTPETQSIDDYLVDGVSMSLTGCTAGEDVTFRIVGADDPETQYWQDSTRADDDGAASATFLPGTGGDGWIGEFVVQAECGDQSVEASFSVTEGDGDAPESELTVSPKSQSLSEFLDGGVSLTMVNCHVDSDVTFRVSTSDDPDTVLWEESQKAGEDAAGYAQFTPEGEGGSSWVGEYRVTATCGDRSDEATFTVTDDGSVVDPKLSVEPSEISGADFVNRDKGVMLTVTACEPEAQVQFEVWSEDFDTKLYAQTARSDDEGTAGVQVYGLADDPQAYIGTYQVKANCLDIGMDGQFVVTGDESGGGTDSGEAGSSGGDSMPRTGAELTGLTAGGLLILGGAAAIVLARRRAQLER